MTILEAAAKALISVATRPAVDRLKRQEAVVALLKKLKLTPRTPPADFDGVYVYTLVEHCHGKPEPVIRFFQNEYIRNAFRQSFESGDPKYLRKEAEGIIRWNDETGELGRIDYDFRREFAGFSAVFNTLVDRTRTAAESRQELKVDTISDDLQDGLRKLHDRITELPSLDSIRQLVTATAETGDLNAITLLAKETKDWFDAIGYRFEKYEPPADGTFTWLVNVPARRGYDRIVVRGTAGEATATDVDDVHGLVEARKADEGWLMVPRRISEAARTAATATDGKVACYTIDSLIDEEADFEPYLTWLDEEIRKRKIDLRYVRPYCRKEEYNRSTGRTVATSIYDDKRGGLDGYVEAWLADPSKEHLSVLGEFGTGKTWFTLHFAAELAGRYKEAKRKGLPRPRLPLVIPLRDYSKAVSVESLFSEFFFRRHQVRIANYSIFEYLNRSGRLLLVFDGFDEMAARVDRQAMINNFWELARVVVPGAKVLITCRTEHFPEAREGRELLSARLKASIQALSGEPPQFEVVDLLPFDDDQVRRLLGHLTNADTVKLIMNNSDLLDLMRRPVMSELTIDALPEIRRGGAVDIARVYLYAVRRKIHRDIQAERTFTSTEDKLFFLCELSWEMYSTDTMSMNYRQFPDRIRACFGAAVQEEKDLDHWHYDMLSQTMLIRNNDGDYTPAHRSLLEFFVAFKLAAELGLLHPDFLDLVTDGAPTADAAPARWSEYFQQREPDGSRAALGGFLPESFDRLATTFGTDPIGFAVIELLIPMLDRERAVPVLLDLARQTREQTKRGVAYVGGNAATLLVRLDAAALRGADLSGCDLTGADLDLREGRSTDLTGTDFREADLSEVDFENACLIDADLTGSRLPANYMIALEPDYPTTIVQDGSGTVLVGTSGGQLLGWPGPDLGVMPTDVALIPAGISELEFIPGTRQLTALTRFHRGCVVLDLISGEVKLEVPDAVGVVLVPTGNRSGVQLLVGHAGAGEATKFTLYETADFTRLGENPNPLYWELSHYDPVSRRTLFVDDEQRLLALDGLDPATGFRELARLDGGGARTLSVLWRVCSSGDHLWTVADDDKDEDIFHQFSLTGELLWSITNPTPRTPQDPWVSYFTCNRWAVGNRAGDLVALTDGRCLHGIRRGDGEVLWTDEDAVGISDMLLLADQETLVTTSRYGAVVARSLATGAVTSRTTLSRNYRGTRFSRDSALPSWLRNTFEANGAVIV